MATATLTPIPGELVDDLPPAVDDRWVRELAATMLGPAVSVQRCGCVLENVEQFGHRPGCGS